jgi:hypothetical protein
MAIDREDIERIAKASAHEVMARIREQEHEILLLNSIPYAYGSPAIVVNEALAKATPCECTRVDDSEICFSKGCVGALSEADKVLYCNPKVYVERPGLAERIRKFKEAVAEAKEKTAGIPKGERLEPWLRAMSESLAKRGIEV